VGSISILKQIGSNGRYGLSIDDVNNVVEAAIGGMTLTTTMKGDSVFL
jgi:Cu(I)/Ag(I) efflux system membrane protein CusA/SilA